VNNTVTKKFSIYTAISLVVANMIGTGVFTSLGFQVIDMNSGFAIILLWIIGGIVALTGAFCYAELSTLFPRSGGEFNYLSNLYHPAIGFMAGWISLSVGFAAPIAAASIALGEYLTSSINLPHNIYGFSYLSTTMIISIVVIILLSIIHSYDKIIGAVFQNIFTVFKFLFIIVLIIIGIINGNYSGVDFSINKQSLSQILSPAFAISLYFVAYSYSGWNASAYISGEVNNPTKSIPLSLIAGTFTVTMLYVLLNFMFLYTVSIPDMAGKVDVGFIYATNILGTNGGKVFGLIISILLVSSVSSMIITGPRINQVIGEDFYMFKLLARKNKKDIPIISILLQAIIAIIYIITSTFEQVITFIGFTLNLFTMLTVIGMVIYRYRHPEIERKYKVPLFPFVPIIFLMINTWILIYGLIYKPKESIYGILISMFGLVLYYINNILKSKEK